MTGIISRNIIEKALYHGLGQLPISEYMHTEYEGATPDTSVTEVQEYIVGHDRRLMPVFDGDDLVGVITRTNLLRYIYSGEDLYDLARENLPVRSRDVERLMQKSLSPRVVEILRDLGGIGQELYLPVYVVGGFVRDLMLGIENDDVDVTVEGNGILFAETFAREYGGRVKSHQKFGTAVIIMQDGFKIDVASTRLEYYSSPGALPTVERSSLKMDLYRRDFTVNTLAIRLNSQEFGHLIDYYGGQKDLQERLIRVLHNLSFVEDPTRVFRAVRFEQRLGFHIAKHTENLIKSAVKMDLLEKVGGKRLLTELVHILLEKEPLRAVERMNDLGLLAFISPKLRLFAANRRVLEEARKIVSWFELLFIDWRGEKWAVYFLALCDSLTDEEFRDTCLRLSVSEHYRERLFEMRRKAGATLETMQKRAVRGPEVKRSEIYHWLAGLPVELLLYMMSRTESDRVKKFISLYFTQLMNIRCSVTGRDLQELGVPPGPQYREILDQVLDARLNDLLESRDDELGYIRRLLKGGSLNP
jgi:tRNA nucleotidyltransferase (CCA-adding enzyme)